MAALSSASTALRPCSEHLSIKRQKAKERTHIYDLSHGEFSPETSPRVGSLVVSSLQLTVDAVPSSSKTPRTVKSPLTGSPTSIDVDPFLLSQSDDNEVRELTFREKVAEMFEDPQSSTLARVISTIIMVAIGITVFAFIFESTSIMKDWPYWSSLEAVCVSLFTTEYFTRLAVCDDYRAFMFNFLNCVDLVAILPFWVELFVATVSNLGFVRVIRMIRVFRILKLGKYSDGLSLFVETMKASAPGLLVLAFMLFIFVILFASIMFYVEIGNPMFPDIPSSVWWCLATMTTVGYGDTYPTSALGKVIAGVTMICGLLIIALPVTVIASNFGQKYHEWQEARHLEQVENSMLNGDEFEKFTAQVHKLHAMAAQFPTVGASIKAGVNGNTIVVFDWFHPEEDIVVPPPKPAAAATSGATAGTAEATPVPKIIRRPSLLIRRQSVDTMVAEKPTVVVDINTGGAEQGPEVKKKE